MTQNAVLVQLMIDKASWPNEAFNLSFSKMLKQNRFLTLLGCLKMLLCAKKHVNINSQSGSNKIFRIQITEERVGAGYNYHGKLITL